MKRKIKVIATSFLIFSIAGIVFIFFFSVFKKLFISSNKKSGIAGNFELKPLSPEIREEYKKQEEEKKNLVKKIVKSAFKDRHAANNGQANKYLNSRQLKIFDLVKFKNGTDMREINKKFKSVSQRTLRRDLDKLENMGYIKQEGKTRNSMYLFNGVNRT